MAKALSAKEITSLRYVGNANVQSAGQAARANMASPLAMRWVDLSVQLDFKSSAMSLEFERVFSDWLYPNFKPSRQIQHSVPGAAWNVSGKNNIAALRDARERQLELWMTPLGIVKLAREAGVATKLTTDKKSGQRMLTFPYKELTVRASLLANDLIDRVEFESDSALHGDVHNELVFGNYRSFEDVSYPSHIVRYQGGIPTLETWITGVSVNTEVPVEVPKEIAERFAAAQLPVAPPVSVEALAPGVFFLAGQSHHSTAIEFKDHIVIFDVPQDDDRTLAVFAAARKAIPNKPIRYAVVSHHHADHAGGLRAAVAEGVILIAHSSNKQFFENAVKRTRKLKPDHLSKHPKKARFNFIDDALVLADETRRVEIHRLQGLRHSDDMLVAYLPNEKILCEVDAFTALPLPPPLPANAPAAPPAPARIVDANALALYENMQRLNMQVEQIAPGHGRVAKLSDLLLQIGKEAK